MFGIFVAATFLLLFGFSARIQAQVSSPSGSADQSLQRSIDFLKRFSESACMRAQGCESWLQELRFSVPEVIETLSSIKNASVTIGNLRKKQEELVLSVGREEARAAALKEKNIETAFDVLRNVNFGFPGRNPIEAMTKQIQTDGNWEDCGQQRRLFTLFGYFSYDREVSLKEGPQTVKLTFHPFVFARGTGWGKAIEEYLNSSKMTIDPEFKVAAPKSVHINKPSNIKRNLDSLNPVEWTWTVRQTTFSSLREGTGQIEVTLHSGNASERPPSLPVRLLGKPWWWPFLWIWENILTVGGLIGFMGGSLIIYYREGIGGVRRWIADRLTGNTEKKP